MTTGWGMGVCGSKKKKGKTNKTKKITTTIKKSGNKNTSKEKGRKEKKKTKSKGGQKRSEVKEQGRDNRRTSNQQVKGKCGGERICDNG